MNDQSSSRLPQSLLDILACPLCEDHPPLELDQENQLLLCVRCHRAFPIRDGIPVLLEEEATIWQRNQSDS